MVIADVDLTDLGVLQGQSLLRNQIVGVLSNAFSFSHHDYFVQTHMVYPKIGNWNMFWFSQV